MELAVATKRVRTRTRAPTRGALAGVLWQLLLLIALAYGIAYLISACFNVASGAAQEEPRSSGLVRGPGIELHAELLCQSAPTRVWERRACNLPK
jgi:hypothetical protein